MQMKEIRKFGSRIGHHFVRIRPDRGNLNGVSKNIMSKSEFTQNLFNRKESSTSIFSGIEGLYKDKEGF